LEQLGAPNLAQTLVDTAVLKILQRKKCGLVNYTM
jgi:hypothetical protein